MEPMGRRACAGGGARMALAERVRKGQVEDAAVAAACGVDAAKIRNNLSGDDEALVVI
jgi:hypothetical protein